MPLAPGTKLGPYEILASIGAGGMGEVYKARDARLERTVAVKILPEHLSGSSELHERFEREAKLISSLSHPHICTLHDIGRQGSVDFLVMEYLEGETLADRLRHGPVPLTEALAIGRDLADALDVAHQHGVVHRDLKPGNIMLTRSGTKLLDFGLAKQQAGVGTGSLSGVSALPTEAKPLTEKGSLLGTFQYMAPEQLEGKEVSPRTDIFALGSVLYEMVTGRRAFEGGSPASLIGAIMSSEPAAPSTLQSMSPPALDHVVEACLAKNPDDRWQSVADVKRELEWIAKSGTASSRTAMPVGRDGRRWILVFAGLVVGLVVASALSLLRAPTDVAGRPLMQFALGDMDLTGGLTFSPDGRHVVFSAVRNGRRQLFRRSLDEPTATPMDGTEEGVAPFFSPDGEWVGYFDGTDLKKVSFRGGSPTTMTHLSSFSGATWSEDGEIFFSTQGSALWQLSASGGEPESFGKLLEGELSHDLPTVLPDRRALLFRVRASGKDSVAVVRRDDGAAHQILAEGSEPAYVPTGHILFNRGSTLFAVGFDPATLSLLGEPRPVVQNVGSSRWSAFAVSSDGTLIYNEAVERTGSQLVWVDRSGQTTPFVEPRDFYRYPRLSPDGRTLAVNIGSDRGDIWIVDMEHGRRRRVTTSGNSNHVAWSPDGERLVYGSDAPGGFDLFTVPSDGSGAAKVLLAQEGVQTPQSWSPEGRAVAFSEERPGGSIDISVVRDEGKVDALVATPFAEAGPKFSPDGRFVAFSSNESGRDEIYVTDYPDARRKWPVSIGGGREAMWARDGRELFFRQGDRMMSAQVSTEPTFSAGEERVLFEGSFATGGFAGNANYDVSLDGRRFLMIERGPMETGRAYVVIHWFDELKRLVPVDE